MCFNNNDDDGYDEDETKKASGKNFFRLQSVGKWFYCNNK